MNNQKTGVDNLNFIEWRHTHEFLMKKWGDKSKCYKLMHAKCEKKYGHLCSWVQITIIIISGLTSSFLFSEKEWDPKTSNVLKNVSACLLMLSSIIHSITEKYINPATMCSEHKIASKSWNQYGSKIQIELSKLREDRGNPDTMIEQFNADYNELINNSPRIPDDVLRWFLSLVKDNKYDDNLVICGSCLYENCFFPFGCGICFTSLCSKKSCRNDSSKDTLSANWGDIELPEILGVIKPTFIVKEDDDTSSNISRINLGNESMDQQDALKDVIIDVSKTESNNAGNNKDDDEENT